MFVKFSRAVVLGIACIMLASCTEASPMPAPVATYGPPKPGTSTTVNCQTCVCQENGGMICDEILCAFTPPVITDTFAPTPTA
ncbi:hypothetical protein FB451DRAFT_1235762 [Mycena latifolia]|nr:hypothetical protein FB451DRAFT_1235762 [Mycena latifolia]